MSDNEEGSYYEEVEEVLDDDEYEVVEEEVTERGLADEEATEQEFTEVSIQESSIHEVSPEDERAAKRAALVKREQELKAKLAILQQQAENQKQKEEAQASQQQPQQEPEAAAAPVPSQPPEAAPMPTPKIEDASIVAPPGAIELPPGPLGVIFSGPNPTVLKTITATSAVKDRLRVGMVIERMIVVGQKEFVGLGPIDLSKALKAYSGQEYTRCFVIQSLGGTRASQQPLAVPPPPVRAPVQSTQQGDPSIVAPPGAIQLPHGPLGIVFRGPNPTVVKKIGDTSAVKGLLEVGDIVEKLIIVGEKEITGLAPIELSSVLKTYSGSQFTRCLVITRNTAVAPKPKSSSVVAPDGSITLPAGPLGVVFSGPTPTIKKIGENSSVQGLLQVGDVVEKLVVVGEKEMTEMTPTELSAALKSYSGAEYTRCLVINRGSVGTGGGPSIVAPEGSIVLPPGKLGITFQGPPSRISKIAEGSSVQGLLKVGDVVERLVIVGEEEMVGLSPIALSNALKSYSGQQHTRCMVISREANGPSSDPSIVAPEGSIMLPPGLLGISFNGKTPTIKKIAQGSTVEGLLQVGDVVEKLVVVGEEEMTDLSPTELSTALKKYSEPQYTRCLVIKESAIPEGSVVLPPGPLGVVFSGPTPTIKKIGENSSVQGLLQVGDVVEKLVVVGEKEMTEMTPTELSAALKSYSGAEYTRCLVLVGSRIQSLSGVQAAPVPSLEGTIPLPLGALGVVFSGTPPTVKQINPSSPMKGVLNVGDKIEELILVGRKQVAEMSSTALTQALKACSGPEYSRFLVVNPASPTASQEPDLSLGNNLPAEAEPDIVSQTFSEEDEANEDVMQDEEELDDDYAEENENAFHEEEEIVSSNEAEEEFPEEADEKFDVQDEESPVSVQEEEATRMAEEEATRKAEEEAALKAKLQAEIAALEAQMEQTKAAEQAALRQKEKDAAAKREAEDAAKKEREAAAAQKEEQEKAAAEAEKARKEKIAAKERQFQESLRKQQERDNAAAPTSQPEKEFYGVEELKSMSVPGLDYANKEKYLTDKDFQGVFGMSKEEFAGIPKWKRVNLKKQVGLF